MLLANLLKPLRRGTRAFFVKVESPQSLPGLTLQSISLRKKMDARVKLAPDPIESSST